MNTGSVSVGYIVKKGSDYDTSLRRYITEISRFPILKAEEEEEALAQYRKTGCIAAAHKVVASHLRLVVKIALGYRGYGIPLADLISEGNMGLMKAVQRFDPGKKSRLSTYARWWIKAYIKEYASKFSSLVRSNTINSNSERNTLTPENTKIPFYENDKLAIETKESYLEEEVNLLDKSVSEEKINDDDGPNEDYLSSSTSDLESRKISVKLNPENYYEDMTDIIDPSANHADMYEHNEDLFKKACSLKSALDKLSDRDKDVFIQRKMRSQPTTLQDLSVKYSVSKERIRQIENSAFDKVKKMISSS